MDNELFELCKSTYEKTGWEVDDAKWVVGDVNGDLFILDDKVKEQGHFDYYTPLYTSDYLLEKLPKFLTLTKEDVFCKLTVGVTGSKGLTKNSHWWAGYESCETRDDIAVHHGDPVELCASDTPLKALLKLCLTLHDAGELHV